MDKMAAIREIYFWQFSNTGCFNQQLLDLFGKADFNNRAKLRLAYPELYEAWIEWNNAGDYGNDLFREHGLLKEPE